MKIWQTEWWLSKIFPDLTWKIDTDRPEIYLTFDDGPIPEVTEFVLDQLGKYNAKATFFCVGENVKRNPDVFEKILTAGHTAANHTYNHLQGWKSPDDVYLDNIAKADQAMVSHTLYKSGGKIPFRPPYGKIKRSQIELLRNNYRIIMWSVLTKDYDPQMSPEKCLARSLALTEPGSVVVFHDSLKARRNMEYALPLFLKHFTEKGYVFREL
jgi:peptidoglycan-N-acetylglucosamine deacetylase